MREPVMQTDLTHRCRSRPECPCPTRNGSRPQSPGTRAEQRISSALRQYNYRSHGRKSRERFMASVAHVARESGSDIDGPGERRERRCGGRCRPRKEASARPDRFPETADRFASVGDLVRYRGRATKNYQQDQQRKKRKKNQTYHSVNDASEASSSTVL